VVVDFNCLYVAMLAHLAFGFSTRQTELIKKAKTICECLVASESTDLKFEESFCSYLLGEFLKSFSSFRVMEVQIQRIMG